MKPTERARAIRKSILETFDGGKRGHVPSAFSLVEILVVLYDQILRFDASNPAWPERDRCILSKGHGCIALYAILADHGFFPKEELPTFCHYGSILGGHPKCGKVPGVEASTGSLGHGLSIALGQALILQQNESKSRVFTILGDGECNEGSIWEAAMAASKHKLDQLTAVIDYNHVQSYGTHEDVQPLEPFAAKWEAFGFAATEVDGHNEAQLKATFESLPLMPGKPTAIICHTTKGKGIPSLENNFAWHHKARVSDEEIDQLMKELADA